MRRMLLALCLVGTLVGSPAAADTIPIEITSGGTDRPFTENNGAFLTLFGDQFSLTAHLAGSAGFFHPGAPYVPGTTIAIDAGWCCSDANGFFTYQGQTREHGGFNTPQFTVEFLSQPFVVPPVDGSPVVQVPFTLTGFITPGVGSPDAFTLHGTGSMTLTFLGPVGPAWGPVLVQPVVTTPEPSSVILVATVLGGLGVCAWRRLRLHRSSAAAI